MKLSVRVKEIMKKDIKIVGIDDTVSQAARIMKNFKIGSVVVMGDKNVKGIITDSDIVYKYVADKCGDRVSDVMTRDLVSILPDATIEDAARLMGEKKIKKLLVFDRNKLVGIITDSDILGVEPALFEILLERMKIRKPTRRTAPRTQTECERCGNYSEETSEIDGEWLCPECAEEAGKEESD